VTEDGARRSDQGSSQADDTRGGVRVFVSYRRDDVPDATDRLTDSLREQLGPEQVFVDVDNIEIGADFAEIIGDWVARCDVLLAVIGRSWLEVTDGEGRPRIEDPDDYVRLEIEAALHRDVRVVPVLIHGATLPRHTELPETLVPLLQRNALELTRKYWSLDVDELVGALEKLAQEKAQQTAATDAVKEQAEREAAAREEMERATAAREDAERDAAAKQAAERQAADEREALRAAKQDVPSQSAPSLQPGLQPGREGSSRGYRERRTLLLGGAAATSVAVIVGVIILASGSSKVSPPARSAQQPHVAQSQTRMTVAECTMVAAQCTNADLSGENFHGATLPQVDLDGSNLSHVDLSHSQLAQVSMKGANLRDANLAGATLSQVDLSDANLCGTNLTGAKLQQTDTTNASCAP
jgi:hypothetical protein